MGLAYELSKSSEKLLELCFIGVPWPKVVSKTQGDVRGLAQGNEIVVILLALFLDAKQKKHDLQRQTGVLQP